MSSYSRRTTDGPRRDIRGRAEVMETRAVNVASKTKWSGQPSRYKSIGSSNLDTIITGHLTQEQIDAYQQYFRIEEISDVLRLSQSQHKDIMSLLPSGNLSENPNYQRDPSPPPKYDNMGNRINTREERTRVFLEKERHYLVEIAASNIKNYISPLDYRKPSKTFEKLYIPVKDYPDINFVGLLLGPRGNTLRQLQEESGARLAIRGKGSVKDGKSTAANNEEEDSNSALSSTSFSNPNLNSSTDDLHVVITSDSQSKIAKAIKLTNAVIEKAISSPVGQNDLKRDQLRELAVLNGTLRETKPYNPEAFQKRQPRYGLDVTQIICKVCGKVGHFARDCKFNNQNNYRKPIDKDNSPDISQVATSEQSKSEDVKTEQGLPPWKKRKTDQILPPWQKAPPPPTDSIVPPPPPGIQSTTLSSIIPPPPTDSIIPPPPPGIQSTTLSSIIPPPPTLVNPPLPPSLVNTLPPPTLTSEPPRAQDEKPPLLSNSVVSPPPPPANAKPLPPINLKPPPPPVISKPPPPPPPA